MQHVFKWAKLSLAECLGVGLVRGVDADAGLLYILSPLPLSALQHVKLLQVRPVRHMKVTSLRNPAGCADKASC